MRLKLGVAVLASGVIAALVWTTRPPSQEAQTAMPDQIPDARTIGGGVRAGYDGPVKLFAGVAGGQQESPEQKDRRRRALLDLVRALDTLLPRDTFDLKAVAAHVGPQPDRLHHWVRQQTTWLPYRGALRGAQGTLMDRAGSSLDRALLLAGLLEAAGTPARLAHVTLADAQVAVLKRARLAAPGNVEQDTEAEDVSRRLQASVDAFATQTGGDAGLIKKELTKALELSRAASDNVRRRVDLQSTRLLGALGIKTPERAGEQVAAELESLRDHWWVQSRTGAEWLDLDPDLADAGSAVGPPEGFMEVSALPNDLRHILRVRVIVEKWSGTQFEEQQVVSVEVIPSDIIGESIRLQHIPMAWPDSLDGPASEIQQRFKAAAQNQREWLPVLTVGNRQVTGPSILDTGDLNSKPGSKPATAAVQGFMDALGGEEPPSPGVLTGEWLEYEIQTPGEKRRVIRREVFDVVGPSARAAGHGPDPLTDPLRLSRSLSLMTDTEILPLPCQLASAFVQHLAVTRILAAEQVLNDFREGRAQADRLKVLQPLPGLLHGFAVARGGLGANPRTVSVQSLNVVARHAFPVMAQDNGAGIAEAIDIVANEVESTAASPAEQFAARLGQGVLDTNLEALMIGPVSPDGGVADLFGLKDGGDPWIGVRSAADLGKLSAPPDVRARMESDLKAGYAVLAPASGPAQSMGWWRVDPRTGSTLGMGHRGWGQAMTEYKLIVAAVGTFSICSVGTYLINGAYTARDRAICAMAGLATMVGGAGIAQVPMFGVSLSYSSLITGSASVAFMPGIPIMTVFAGLIVTVADALGFHW